MICTKKGLLAISDIVIPLSVEYIETMGREPAFLCTFPAKKGLLDCWNQPIDKVVTEFSVNYFGISSNPSKEEIENTKKNIYKKGLPVVVDQSKVNSLIASFGNDVQWDCDDVRDCSMAVASYISGLNPSSKNPDVKILLEDENEKNVRDEIRFITEYITENNNKIKKFLKENNIDYKVFNLKENPYDRSFQKEKIEKGLRENNIVIKSYVIKIGQYQTNIRNNVAPDSKLEDLKKLG
jgi:hypothetical protein